MRTMAAIAEICKTAIISGGVVRILSQDRRTQLGSCCRWRLIQVSMDRVSKSVEMVQSDESSQPWVVRRMPLGIAALESIAEKTVPYSFSNIAGGEHPVMVSKTASPARESSCVGEGVFMPNPTCTPRT